MAPPTGDQVFKHMSLWGKSLVQTGGSQQHLVTVRLSRCHWPLPSVCSPLNELNLGDMQQVSARSSDIARKLLLLISPQMPSHSQPWVKITSTSFQLTEWPSSHWQTAEQFHALSRGTFLQGTLMSCSTRLHFPHYTFSETLNPFQVWFQNLGSWFSQSSICCRSKRTWVWFSSLRRKLGMVAHACNLRAGDAETGESCGSPDSQCSWMESTRTFKGSVSKASKQTTHKADGSWGMMWRLALLWGARWLGA